MRIIFMKKLLIPFLISTLLLFQVALASDFSVSVDKDANYKFYAGMTDYVTLTISNQGQKGLFSVAIFGVPSEWVMPENQNSLMEIPSMSIGVTRIKVSPSRDAVPNVYKYYYKINRVGSSDSVSGEDSKLLINVVQTTSAILKDVSLSCTVCTAKVDVSGKVMVFGAKPLDLTLVLKYGNFQKSVNIGSVDYTEIKDFETSLDLTDMTPNDYTLSTSLIDANGKLLYEESASFSIPAINNVVYDKKVSSTPFGSSVMVTATNLGNVEAVADLRSASPSNWYALVMGPNPSGMMTGYYVWSKSLAPKDSVSLNYSEIYWPTYVVIVAIVGLVLFIFYQQSAFTISKNVIGRTTFKSGKDISISLNLKSRRRNIDKVAIRDIVPANFSIVSNFETVKPLIRKVNEGVELIWKLGYMNPNEERVLHYTIRPGENTRKTALPSAMAKAAIGTGVTLKRSNRVYLAPENEPVKMVSVKVAK
jgi:hypothetical protein